MSTGRASELASREGSSAASRRGFHGNLNLQFRVSIDYTNIDSASNSPVGQIRAVVMNSLRVPLSAFPSADVTNVACVDLLFDQTPKGRSVVSDLAVAEEGTTVAESRRSQTVSPTSHAQNGNGARVAARRWRDRLRSAASQWWMISVPATLKPD